MYLKNEQEWTEVFAKRLKLAMKEQHISNTKLAEEIGVGENSVINYRTGKSLPNLYTTARMARVLGVSIDYLACLEYVDIFEVAGFTKEQSVNMRQTCEVCCIDPDKLISVVRQLEEIKKKEKKNGIFK